MIESCESINEQTHSINICMNVIGAMVHPMSLTFVEFLKNDGYEGGGKEYKPFKK